ncbi:MAG: hypothetical protein ABJC89_02695 [Acidobacteriota bacterium]
MKDTPVDDDRYLWDRTGEPDPETARLEALLAPLRHRGVPPVLPARQVVDGRLTRWKLPALAAAAMIVLCAGAAWLLYPDRHSGWSVEGVSGTPLVVDRTSGGTRTRGAGVSVGEIARLGIGSALTTDGGSRARLAVGRIGSVEVDPNTHVLIEPAAVGQHRMSLQSGTIHARISAPPYIFFVNTPSAVAVDLGCEYTLQVDESGAGLIRVTLGWVAFEHDGRQSFIPAGAVGATRPGSGPGTPRYEDAPSGYGDALAVLDFSAAADLRRAAALDLILSTARRRDALTLWHLLRDGTPEDRARVYARLAALAPPPSGVTQEAILRGEPAALNQWWDSIGIGNRSWWRLWKKK